MVRGPCLLLAAGNTTTMKQLQYRQQHTAATMSASMPSAIHVSAPLQLWYSSHGTAVILPNTYKSDGCMHLLLLTLLVSRLADCYHPTWLYTVLQSATCYDHTYTGWVFC